MIHTYFEEVGLRYTWHMTIVGFVGSLRAESYNRKLMDVVRQLLPAEDSFTEGSFAELPLYRKELETPMPEAVVALQTRIKNADGIIFATPEYNRSIPGGLKNMLDWCSRGELKDCFKEKPVMILGGSSGNLGTVVAQYDLRRVMLYFGAHVMGNPELFVGRVQEKFTEAGELTDEKTREKLQEGVSAFEAFIRG